MLTKAAKRKTRPEYPTEWQKLSQGERVKAELELVLAPILERIFGYHLVKVGNLSSALELTSSPIRHKVCFAQFDSGRVDLFGKSNELPFQNNSVDAFVVLAELDFAKDPHQIVREIERTLTSDGRVIIAGFNPISLAGVLKYLPINRGNMLHHGRFFTPGRIKDWLQLLNFEIVQQEHLVYSSLFAEEGIAGKNRWLMGISRRFITWYKRYLPWFSSMYIIVARKREIPLSPIKAKWKLQSGFKPGTATANLSSRKKANTI